MVADHYAKAIVGMVGAFLTAMLTALGDGHITATEWLVAALSALGTASVVWAVPNSAPPNPAVPPTKTEAG